MTTLAARYGLSDVGLRKKCKKLKIPLAPQGYFFRAESRKQGLRPPLPPVDGNDNIKFVINQGPQLPPQEEPQEVKTQLEFESFVENRIVVTSTLSTPHPLIQKFKASLNKLSY